MGQGAPLDLIAIDGPAGSGKSAVARELARRLGRFHLDTGALYRGLTWKALEDRLDLDDEEALASLVRSTDLAFDLDGKLLVDGQDRSREIRTLEVTRRIYQVAQKAKVRSALGPIQRALASERLSVAEGRDMGSAVFPDARWKFYLDAEEEVRAERRWRELSPASPPVTREAVLQELRERDRRDLTRKAAPLVCPPDAVRIDTTRLSVEEVVREIVGVVRG